MPTIRVTDRTYEDMLQGAEFVHWPDPHAPHVGERVVIFDRNLDFTQHDVLEQDCRRVLVGPAIPWDHREDSSRWKSGSLSDHARYARELDEAEADRWKA